MNGIELIEKLKIYGADIKGIQDRFMGDVELFSKCYEDFLAEKNFAILDKAMKSEDYDAAFKPAHALKGLSGNLGLTPFYETLRVLVESLRAGDERNVQAEYEAVLDALGMLKTLETLQAQASEKPPETETRAETLIKPEIKKREPFIDSKHFIPLLITGLTLCMLLLVLLFVDLQNAYRHDPEYLVLLCAGVILAFAASTILVFLHVFKRRKKLFDRALISRERMFDLLVQNTSSAFALLRVDRREPLYVSPNIERLTGLTAVYLEKADPGYRLKAPDGTETSGMVTINERLSVWDGQGEFASDFIPSVRKDRATRYQVFYLYAVEGSENEFVAIAQDRTQAHDREATVRDALAMAERSNAAKSRFLSNMSHDIRTPMNAIINMTDFAIASADNPQRQAECLQIVRDSSQHLLRLVNNVLDMSRIESGQTRIENQSFNLGVALEGICEIVQPLCTAKQQTFITSYNNVRALNILGDQLKLSQILINLLANAVKFTPRRGAVRFIATRIPALQDELAEIRFIVEDNGIGISQTDAAHVFDPFMRAEDHRINEVEGTGLGLSICKSYVNAMGGSILCESEPENGSTFTVELTFPLAQELVSEPISGGEFIGKTPFAGMRCLLCEDNTTNQLIARTMLENLGFQVDAADDGDTGATRFFCSPDGKYDLIYMDIQMPGMNGYQTALAIRGSRHPQAATIPIVAMSANVFTEDVERARCSGMSGFIGKPFSVTELVKESCRAMRAGGAGWGASGGES